LLVSNDPSVPPKQNPGAGVRQIAFAFPPDEPSGTGALYGCMFSESIVNPTDFETEVSACEMAVTVTPAGLVLLPPSIGTLIVGTVLGATYKPLADIEPQTEAGVVPQLSCQVTAVFDMPLTLAENCTSGTSRYSIHRY